jgi:hypothetical protein
MRTASPTAEGVSAPALASVAASPSTGSGILRGFVVIETRCEVVRTGREYTRSAGADQTDRRSAAIDDARVGRRREAEHVVGHRHVGLDVLEIDQPHRAIRLGDLEAAHEPIARVDPDP